MNFSSLDVHLHHEALLNAMNYLNNLLPKQETKITEELVQEKEEKKDVLKKLSKLVFILVPPASFCFALYPPSPHHTGHVTVSLVAEVGRSS